MKGLIVIVFFLFSGFAEAKLNVVTSTSTLKSLVSEIGKGKVQVTSITRSTQDPHFVEAKPSYMVKLRQADLLVVVGLDLEVGWMGNVQRGSKNPKLLPGNTGYFEAGKHITAIEIPAGKIDRAKGDVHPYGNPHFHLDPLKMIKVAEALAEKLGNLDEENSAFYKEQADKFNEKVRAKMKDWQAKIRNSKVKNVLTYHKSFNYFLKRFNLVPISTIEPVPGVPPTAKHIISLIKMVKEENVKCILNEDYFETTAGKRIQKESQATLQVVPVEVQTDYFDLIGTHVNAIAACGKGA